MRLRIQWRIRSIQIDKNFITHSLIVIGVPYHPTDDEVVNLKRLGNKVLVDLYRSNPLIVIRDALVGQKFKHFQSWECRIKSFFKNFIDKNYITQFMLTCRKRSHSSTRTTCWRLKTLKHSINRCVSKKLKTKESGTACTCTCFLRDVSGVMEDRRESVSVKFPTSSTPIILLQGRTQRGFEGGFTKSSWGLGMLWAPQRGPGRSPGRFWN